MKTWTPTPPPTHTPTNIPTFTPTPVTPTSTPFASVVYWDAEEYFGSDVNAVITVEDPDIDTDPMVQETVQVRVWSQNTDPYPGGLTVTLYEDGPSNTRFRSIFPHVRFGSETRPADNILGVTEGETVYVRYIDATTAEERLDSAVWRSNTMFIQFLMPGTTFSEGDIFSCDLQFTNAGETIQVDLYVLLDVFGVFFAYPTWQNISEGLPKDTTFIPGGEQGVIQILPPFTMPAVGQSGPYYFYGAMFAAGELTIESLVADVAVAAFYFE
ncbi:MAG TPA: hypothetical protein PLV45_13635 [bacterium]|nr:hypothetical protein [bacterium]